MRYVLLNILLFGAFFLNAYANEKTENKQDFITSTTEKIEEVAKEVKDSTDTFLKEANNTSKEIIKEAQTNIVDKANEVKETIITTTNQIKDEAKQEIDDATLNIEALIDKGAKVYQKCAVCHGTKAEKKALNNSNIIQGWEATKTIKSLNDYKNNNYGNAMKSIMKGQVINLNSSDIDAVARYIEQL